MSRYKPGPLGPPPPQEDTDRPAPREVRRGRDAAIANLDKAIDSLTAASTAADEPALDQLLKDAILVRAEARHLQIDWDSVEPDMARLKRKVEALNLRLEQWLGGKR